MDRGIYPRRGGGASAPSDSPIDDRTGVAAPSGMESDGRSDIIDLEAYRRRRPESRRTAFAVWGGEGERSRLALPLWRAIYLVGGERGGLVWLEEGADPSDGLNPFFVLDLAEEEPRTAFPPSILGDVRNAVTGAPILSDAIPGGVAVFLGLDRGRRWFLVVDDGGLPREALDPTSRNDLLFIAGECSGLIIHRRLDEIPVEETRDFDWSADEGWDEEGGEGTGDGDPVDEPDPEPDPGGPGGRHLRSI